MDEEINLAPPLFNRAKGCIHFSIIGDICRHHEIHADAFHQRAYTPLKRLALIGKGQFCALCH